MLSLKCDIVILAWGHPKTPNKPNKSDRQKGIYLTSLGL